MSFLETKGKLEHMTMGNDLLSNEIPYLYVPRGAWFGGFLSKENKDNDDFALLGCTCAPGFDPADFFTAGECFSPSFAYPPLLFSLHINLSKLGRTELLEKFPQHKDVVVKLTPPDAS